MRLQSCVRRVLVMQGNLDGIARLIIARLHAGRAAHVRSEPEGLAQMIFKAMNTIRRHGGFEPLSLKTI